MIGKILGTAVRVVNAPIRAVETILGDEDDEQRVLSYPGEVLAKELERIDEE